MMASRSFRSVLWAHSTAHSQARPRGPATQYGEGPFYDARLEREANDFAPNVLMPSTLAAAHSGIARLALA